jgi:hypothetical protein
MVHQGRKRPVAVDIGIRMTVRSNPPQHGPAIILIVTTHQYLLVRTSDAVHGCVGVEG